MKDPCFIRLISTTSLPPFIAINSSPLIWSESLAKVQPVLPHYKASYSSPLTDWPILSWNLIIQKKKFFLVVNLQQSTSCIVNILVDSCNVFLLDAGSLESQFDWLKELHYTILLRQGDIGKAAVHTGTLRVPFPFPGLHTIICTVCELGMVFTIWGCLEVSLWVLQTTTLNQQK